GRCSSSAKDAWCSGCWRSIVRDNGEARRCSPGFFAAQGSGGTPWKGVTTLPRPFRACHLPLFCSMAWKSPRLRKIIQVRLSSIDPQRAQRLSGKVVKAEANSLARKNGIKYVRTLYRTVPVNSGRLQLLNDL